MWAALERGYAAGSARPGRSEVDGAVFQRLLEVTVNCEFARTEVLHEVRVHVHTVVTLQLQLKDALQLRLHRLNHGYVAAPQALPVASDQVGIATVQTRSSGERLPPSACAAAAVGYTRTIRTRPLTRSCT